MLAVTLALSGGALAMEPPALGDRAAAPIWSAQVGGGAGATELGARGGVVIALSWEGDLQALDAATGTALWSHSGPWDDAISGDGPAFALGTDQVVLPGAEGGLEGRALRTGEVTWARDLPAAPGSLVACPGWQLAAVTHRASVDGRPALVAHALDPATGESLWATQAPGALVGAGGDHLFTQTPSGIGRLGAGMVALRCADGVPIELPDHDLPFARYLHAADSAVVTAHFDMARREQALCATDLARPYEGRRCLGVGPLAPEGYWLGEAVARDGAVLFSMFHIEAYNLDPTPDAWLFRWDLESGEVERSEAGVSRGEILDLGGSLLTSFGATGASDRVHFVETDTLRIDRGASAAKAPGPLAADADRAYAALYGGEVIAVERPFPDAEPDAERAVEPQPVSFDAPGASALSPVAVLDAHPRRAHTSGQETDGAVGAIAWLDDGRVITGGNDNRIRVYDAATGQERFRADPLSKDVQQVAACQDDRMAARIYGGPIAIYTPSGAGWRQARLIEHDGSWTMGLTGNCKRLLSDDLGPNFTIYDPTTGAAVDSFTTGRGFDIRGTRVREDQIAVSWGRGIKVLAVAGERPVVTATWPDLPLSEAGRLVQAWPAGEAEVVLEYCGAGACEVMRMERDGRISWRHTLDTAGAVWSDSIPSTLDLSPNGRWLFFHRDGLEAALIEVATGARYGLGEIPRTMSATPEASFSPDGRSLAVTMTPAPWQVAIYALP